MSTAYRPGDGLQNWARAMPNIVQAGDTLSCHGSPEGNIPAPVGKICIDLDTGYLYQKERSGGMAVGWAQRGIGITGAAVASGGAGTGIAFMTTADRNAWTPSVAYTAVLLTDSVPPFQLSIWANGTWN